MKITPLDNKIIIEVISEKQTSSLFIPEVSKQLSDKGIVISVGRGRLLNNGKIIPSEVKVGDIVQFQLYGGTDIKIEGKEYKILIEDDILGILE